MLKIKNLQAALADSDKLILHNVNLEIKPGEIHFLRGKNGSGKSTLASVLAGDPKFAMHAGEITLTEEDKRPAWEKLDYAGGELALGALAPEQRAWTGIFVAQQYPLEIPGVELTNFLRLAYNFQHPAQLSVVQFHKLLQSRAQLLNYPAHLLERNLNEGFSGGEKKKTEILQLAMLEPSYAILDETDSGLDPAAIGEVFSGLAKLKQEFLPNLALLVISHYDKVQDYLPSQFVHTMANGVLNS